MKVKRTNFKRCSSSWQSHQRAEQSVGARLCVREVVRHRLMDSQRHHWCVCCSFFSTSKDRSVVMQNLSQISSSSSSSCLPALLLFLPGSSFDVALCCNHGPERNQMLFGPAQWEGTEWRRVQGYPRVFAVNLAALKQTTEKHKDMKTCWTLFVF